MTFRRWGRAWLAFLAVGVPFGILLGALYPNEHLSDDIYTASSAIGTFWGAGIGYLLVFGWWLDHVLAPAGFKVALIVQSLIAGGVGMVGGSNGETSGDPLGFPLVYLALFGVIAGGFAQFIAKKVEGSFASPEGGYPLPPM